MKKVNFLLFIITWLTYTQVQAQVHYQNTTTNETNSSAIGYGTTASGEKSFASGINSTAEGICSTTLGQFNYAKGHYAITIGCNLEANEIRSMVIGSGFSDYFKLKNNKLNSLMIGFLSQYPTLFIGTSPAYNKTGRIGIGNVTAPQAKLHIKADEGEEAAVLIEPNKWQPGAQAALWLGNTNHGIKAVEDAGLTFQTEKNYYFPDGNVSIGRSISGNPAAELDVNGTVQMTGLRLTGHLIQEGFIMVSADQNGEAHWQNPAEIFKPLWTENPQGDIYRLSKVGIGTEDPQEKLDIEGNLTLNDAIIGKQTNVPSDWNDPDFLTIKGSVNNAAAKIMIPKGFNSEHNALKIINPAIDGGIQFSVEGVINFQIRKDDIVMGRPDNETELKVNGKIWTNEVEVRVEGWWDEVFGKNYVLMPLNKLEGYIKTNKHLPGIPTETEVMKNGVKLGEMNALLLKKVEELTLYVIELKKQIEVLKKKH